MMLRSKPRFTLALALIGASIVAAGFHNSRSGRAHAQGPAGGLSHSDISTVIHHAVAKANSTASAQGLRSDAAVAAIKRPTKMIIAVVARNGQLLKVYSQPDAWVGSQDIAIAKARTAAFFSSNENALTSRIVGVLSQAHSPDGSGGAGPLWGIGNSNQVGITGGPQLRNGIITFPGGVPLYKHGRLAGGVGVSGDAVDQDEAVAFAGAVGFEPGAGVVKLGMTPPSVPSYP